MSKKAIQITSLSEFINDVSLQSKQSFHSRTTNFRSIYRGQPNREWNIEPAVYRNNRFSGEMEYVREMERLEPEEFLTLSRIEKIVKMQHYGIPTRLLDFSYNSLVALYFACCSNPEKDGVVFELNAFPLYNQDFVWVSIVLKYLFEYSRLPFNTEQMIEELKHEVELYPQRGVETFYNTDAIQKILTTPIGLYPRLTNDRIKSQDGVFIMGGMNIKEKNIDGIVFEKQSYSSINQLWPESREIIIPSSTKSEILQALDKIGINRRKLFPELSVQADYVTEYIDALAR